MSSSNFIKDIIEKFLEERKNLKIKEKIKPHFSENEKQKVFDELERLFSFEEWVIDASKRASQLTMASHPSKFSHPDAKTSSIIAKNNKENNGYLHSGNVDCELDVFGNAAALDVYKFLTLRTEDNKTILDHLEVDSLEVRQAFSNLAQSYEIIKESFLAIKQSDDLTKTDRLVKQVYFPIKENSYHLLSILTSSGLITEFKNKIDIIRFSENVKEAKECRKNKKHYEGGFDDLSDLTILGYGGTKPQNISILNSKNGGRSYLLPSLPPKITKREIRLPNRNFFENSLWIKNFKDDFDYLQKIILAKRNNIKIRTSRAELIEAIIIRVLGLASKISNSSKIGWSNEENYKKLPYSQKIWLDDFYLKERNETEGWIDEISIDFARWIIGTYKILFEEKAEMLSDEEFFYLKEEAKEEIKEEAKKLLIKRSFL